MNITAVQAELGERLKTIAGLRVYPWNVPTVTPPAASVALPESVTFDATYGRGSDTMVFEILVVVGTASDRGATLAMAEYLAGAGPSSVKEAVDGRGTAFDEATVESAEPQVVTISGTAYQGAAFKVNIYGRGGS